MRAYITGVWAYRQRVITTFLTRKNSQVFLVLPTGFELGSGNPLDLESDALPTEPPRHPFSILVEVYSLGMRLTHFNVAIMTVPAMDAMVCSPSSLPLLCCGTTPFLLFSEEHLSHLFRSPVEDASFILLRSNSFSFSLPPAPRAHIIWRV